MKSNEVGYILADKDELGGVLVGEWSTKRVWLYEKISDYLNCQPCIDEWQVSVEEWDELDRLKAFDVEL